MASRFITTDLFQTLQCHSSDINSVAFSDSTFATCSSDKTVRLFESDSFTEVAQSPFIAHTYGVHCCAFSKGGDRLGTCSTDGKAIVWECKSGKKVAIFEHRSGSCIRVCRFSPDSKNFATGSDDFTVCLWNLEHSQLIKTFDDHGGSVVALTFSPENNYIISGSTAGGLHVWDGVYRHSQCLKYDADGHDLGVTCCCFSPTFGSAGFIGSVSDVCLLLATTGQDSVIKLWVFRAKAGSTAVTLTQRDTLKGHTMTVTHCAFSNDGLYLASSSFDKTVRIWNPSNGQSIYKIYEHTRYVTCCVFSSDDRYLASGSNDKTVLIWKVDKQSNTTADNKPAVKSVEQTASHCHPATAMREWSCKEVCQFIDDLGLAQYREVFNKNHIDGQEFLLMNHDNMEKSLGIESFGHRNKIIRARGKVQDKLGFQDPNIPDEYLCPITREIMVEPVIASDGYTYERAAIQSWLENGKDRSPMTNAVLTDKTLTPNRSLHMLIQKYK